MNKTILRNFIIQDHKNVEYRITNLYDIINDIIQIHRVLSAKFLEINRFNLKKTLVKDIVYQLNENKFIINKDFIETVKAYLNVLDRLTVDVDLEYTYADFDFRLRVKQLESVIYKLHRYNFIKDEAGKIPINKCLNDLLGFRVVIPNFSHDCMIFENMCEFIRKNYKIRYINASKGDYRATHIYFHGDSNKNFPWELQIWLPDDHETNHESHAKHKQDYIKSAEIYKEALKDT